MAEAQIISRSDPVEVGEKRTLTLDAQRVDGRHLVDGQLPAIEAELTSTRRSRRVRNYRVARLGLNIKPAADCTDDIALIERIVQSHMEPSAGEAREPDAI